MHGFFLGERLEPRRHILWIGYWWMEKLSHRCTDIWKTSGRKDKATEVQIMDLVLISGKIKPQMYGYLEN
jgi:hypothetical protein